MPIIRSIVELAHEYLSRVVLPGDIVIDATVGNGGDTAVLCRLVGENGRVYGFDIQEEALKAASRYLAEQKLLDRTELIAAGHEHIKEYVKTPIKAVIFNLGYLPGGDHGVATEAETTITGIEQGLELLVSGGLMAVAVYWGHPQGEKEKNALADFLRKPKMRSWQVMEISLPNREKAPCLLIIEKKEKGTA
ncbi:MAG: class I SAM-dependent methyltransferase [Bacillota bacterium]|nr:class I SAM-dependent methyltransferase [Bacillota bacterium]